MVFASCITKADMQKRKAGRSLENMVPYAVGGIPYAVLHDEHFIMVLHWICTSVRLRYAKRTLACPP